RLNTNGGTLVEIAITEGNICLGNNVASDDLIVDPAHPLVTDPLHFQYANTTPGADVAITGTGANGFIAGQFWTEMMAECMYANDPATTDAKIQFFNFWSIKEGGSGPMNVGYLDGATSNKKSTYYHFKMIANYFKGDFYSVPIGTPITQPNVKAYTCKTSNYIAVMILNQQQSPASQDFEVHLDGGTASTLPLDISFAAGGTTGASYGYKSTTNNIPIENQSTVLLIFDCNGTFVKRYDYKMSSPSVDPLTTTVETGSGTITTAVFTPAIVSGSTIGYPALYNVSGGTVGPISSTAVFPYFSTSGTNFTVDPDATSGPVTVTITVTGSNGCSQTQDVVFYPNGLVVGLAPTGTISSTPATCAGGYANGTASLNSIICPTGASACSILWSTGSSATSIYGLTPGGYSVTITDPGSSSSAFDDRSTTYKVYLNTDFNQQSEVTNYILWENYIKMAGTLTVKNGGTLDLQNNNFEFAPNAKIVVESGGILNIANATLQSLPSCAGTWGGIEVQPGGVINLNSGSVIKINGTGHLFIDGNATASGILNYNQGASVELQNNTSVMEIKGQLNIAANTDFTYTGNGYVKFSSPNSPSNNITAGIGSSMTFQRSSSTQKALEITQETLYGPANLTSFKVNKCKVEMGTNSRLAPLGLSTKIIFTNAKLTSNGGLAHRGLSIFGQPVVTINNSTFEGGKYGIYALLTYGGSSL
ncbi:MAG: hypothetical protein H0U44_06300, partial [Flavisolibacter sp.]|nr:hypothetical protein [Flavisolibacter sp.]